MRLALASWLVALRRAGASQKNLYNLISEYRDY